MAGSSPVASLRFADPQTQAPVLARILPTGGIRIAPRTEKAKKFLETLDYIKVTPNGFGTWWTYCSDLRRDLGKNLQYTPESANVLKTLIGAVHQSAKGRDAEILQLFSEKRQPYPYQLKGIHTGLNVEKLLLADDVGLGKTPQSWGIMLAAMKRGLIDRGVIICPAGLKTQWFEEILEFTRDTSIMESVAVITRKHDAEARREVYRKAWKVLIVNPEIVLRDAEAMSYFAKSVGCVILDEASCIKNSEAQTSKAIKYLFGRTRFRIALTATPIENALADLYSIFEWVDRRVFISRAYFNKRYVIWRKKRFKVKTKRGAEVMVTKVEPARYQNLGEVRTKIKPNHLRRRVHEVGQQLPELVVQWETVELGPKQRQIYEACKRDALIKLKNMRGQATLVPLQGLRQACNSSQLVLKGKHRPLQVKVDRLKELLANELAGERVIVFTDYARFVEILMHELRDFKPVRYTGKMTPKDREHSLRAFKSGFSRLLLATAAGQRGHNLQAGSVLVNIDLPFNPAILKQRIGRARRLRSEHKTVRVINMIAQGTVEEFLILKRIYSKRKLFEAIFSEDELTEADPIERMGGAEIAKYL